MPDKVTIRDCSIGYELKNGEGVTKLLLNGIGMSMNHWMPFVDAYSQHAPFLLHDFRGQLFSEKPRGGYSLQNHADDTVQLMDHLGIETADIIGTSYGSEVAMEFAIAYPRRTRSLVIIDGVSELDPVLTAAVESWKSAALSDPRVFYRSLIPWNYSAGYLETHLAQLREREELVAGLPQEYFQAFASLCDAFAEIDLTPRLEMIQCPSLVMVGENDILKHRGFARIIADNIAGSRLEIIPSAGHAVVIEQPGEVARRTHDFLKQLE
ncbi:alpha/beta fold hydrolase [Salinispira pacifica]|uniref:Putative hydrolase n=1 Tax=Salinispira pacifica TaxID=1307761 RepID=V5WJX4_9SPIO|nr:alpha/beta fold hydrolase [Salinispira pacifica]AHC16033.1 Putative hydrolase [Salinispira pacifica]